MYVVADPFPTSFHMQEVQEVSELLISGAARAAFDINEAEKGIRIHREVFETAKKSYLNGTFSAKILSNKIKAAHQGFRSWLASDVAGGINVFVKKFLQEDCVHCMKQMSHQKNKQFKDLLLLFNALEQLYEELERILTSLRLCLNDEDVIDLL